MEELVGLETALRIEYEEHHHQVKHISQLTGRMPNWLIKKAVKEGYIYVDPLHRDRFISNLQPASVDITLDHTVKYFKPFIAIDPTKPQADNMWDLVLPHEDLENDYLIHGRGPLVESARLLFAAQNMFMAGVDNEGYFFVIPPLGFCLGSIREFVGVSECIEYLLAGKSKVARCGGGVEDAGFADPGFHGCMTIEIRNANLFNPLILRYGMKIGQLLFTILSAPSDGKYGEERFNNHFNLSYKVVAGSGEGPSS